MAGSISGDVLDEKEIREYIVGEGVASGGRFVELLRSAQEAGELPKQFKPAVVAQIIGTYIQGMSRAALISYDRQRIERQVEVFLTGFGLWKGRLPGLAFLFYAGGVLTVTAVYIFLLLWQS